ncbi:MAG: hypothetical protein K2M79_05505 [Muribaculaceae bacterium]|nr:hypothetical protein [Muribaculaceae bacterium]
MQNDDGSKRKWWTKIGGFAGLAVLAFIVRGCLGGFSWESSSSGGSSLSGPNVNTDVAKPVSVPHVPRGLTVPMVKQSKLRQIIDSIGEDLKEKTRNSTDLIKRGEAARASIHKALSSGHAPLQREKDEVEEPVIEDADDSVSME